MSHSYWVDCADKGAEVGLDGAQMGGSGWCIWPDAAECGGMLCKMLGNWVEV